MARLAVLSAAALTLWLAGPRAWTVLERRVGGADVRAGAAPVVELDRVGFGARPSWLVGQLLIAVMRDLEPRLQGRLAIMDEAGAEGLRERLLGSPWVSGADLRRVFPDRFSVDLQLRRPVLEVWVGAGGPAHVLVDGDGVCLPVAQAGLPRTVLVNGVAIPRHRLLGRPHPDARVRAAALVAAEWRDRVCAELPAVPRLVEVDAANLGYHFLGDGRWSEVRVGLARRDGGTAYLAFGHPPGSAAPRIPISTKVEILTAMLREYPGLEGIEGGDLRFANRWRDWVRPREATTLAR